MRRAAPPTPLPPPLLAIPLYSTSIPMPGWMVPGWGEFVSNLARIKNFIGFQGFSIHS